MLSSIKHLHSEQTLKQYLGCKPCSALKPGTYYMFHTQFDAFFCSCGRVVINPYTVCHIAGNSIDKALISDRTGKRLPYDAFVMLTASLASANYVMYDITSAVKLFGIKKVISDIDAIRDSYYKNTVEAILVTKWADDTTTSQKCSVNTLYREIFNVDDTFLRHDSISKIIERYLIINNINYSVVSNEHLCKSDEYMLATL